MSTGPKYLAKVRRVFAELSYHPERCNGEPVAVLTRQPFMFSWR